MKFCRLGESARARRRTAALQRKKMRVLIAKSSATEAEKEALFRQFNKVVT